MDGQAVKRRIPFTSRGAVKGTALFLLLIFGAVALLSLAMTLYCEMTGQFKQQAFWQSSDCQTAANHYARNAAEYLFGGARGDVMTGRSLQESETNFRYIIYEGMKSGDPVATNLPHTKTETGVKLSSPIVNYTYGELQDNAAYIGWWVIRVQTGTQEQTEIIPSDRVLSREFQAVLDANGWEYDYARRILWIEQPYVGVPMRVAGGALTSEEWDGERGFFTLTPEMLVSGIYDEALAMVQYGDEEASQDLSVVQTFIAESGEVQLVTATPVYQDYLVEGFVDMLLRADDVFARSAATREWMDNWDLPWSAVACLAGNALVCVICLVICLCGCGRREDTDEVVLGWFDRIPLDVVLLVLLSAFTAALVGGYELVINSGRMIQFVGLGLLYLAALFLLALLFTCTTRLKAGCLFGNILLVKILRGLVWGARRMWGAACELALMLPLVWRWVLGAAIVLMLQFSLIWNTRWHNGFVLLVIALDAALLVGMLWIARQMRRLQVAGYALSQGDTDFTIDTTHMLLSFAFHARDLEQIGQSIDRAVEQRLKSERMKTELITNVSHDIKTPLTSIINYVDLLQKEELPEQAAEYVAILQKQAARMKKLTEDVVEASKAGTGNVEVHPAPTDVSELLHQAAGEYQQQLEDAGLQAVLTVEDGLWANVDGRLMWRVLDNLLNNACKYALSGTRLYMDGAARGDGLVIALKNISREPLNLSGEDLTERFVRGDSSRSTEGSGLGLSIAQSLVELQGGTLRLMVDGDLFKAEIQLPQRMQAPAQPPEEPTATLPVTVDVSEIPETQEV